ncbi:GFA family protein [Shewanella sp. VB17]|uniref:GFA family protein n=1 Tax=Shewanella sp. VB17 TaxID=2739432 RepID=UPI001565CC55|nr:GFA family protein [Shewanella sp. VB17]NRD72052.1 GFA family protein [Shewanella sp. VB17]
MVTGECNCGEVAFEIASSITDVFICHCSICRLATGSNGIAVIVINNSDFRWIKGRKLIHTWDKPGHNWQTSFCQHCGSPLPGADDSSRMYVPVGLITQGGENLKVAHHIWVDSKAIWDQISDSGKQHQKAFVK